ncbi:hypothetical protein E4T48_03601 [Aureobasidium sp. EXF-10727]|nr:hypothetical protein E4T48_03601 [Aureobasidium sp. EXF-10727]
MSSDLCYNCHQIHGPRTCEKPLQECLNCGAFGHTWNFCHLGALRLQPDYKHLPAPCKEELVRCGGCMQIGHLPEYCALDPTPSSLFTGNMSNFISHNLTADNAQWIVHNASLADEVYKIKMGAVMDTLQLFTGRNREEVRTYLANAYRGQPQPSGASSYHPISTQPFASKQLPTPAAVKTENNSGLSLSRPNIPQTQVRGQSYEAYNTLAPLQFQDGDKQSHQQSKALNTVDAMTSGSSSNSSTNHESGAAPGVQKTLVEPSSAHDSIFNFRTYGDGGQGESRGHNSGNGSITPRSSPCDDRASSAESKYEEEQEREFFEGALY